MNNSAASYILLAILLSPFPAMAADGKITISSPMDGAMVSAGEKIKLSYDATLDQNGDHLHLNVDGKRIDVLRQLMDTVEVAGLSPGKHQLCLMMNTKGHVPTGTETCVNVEAK